MLRLLISSFSFNSFPLSIPRHHPQNLINPLEILLLIPELLHDLLHTRAINNVLHTTLPRLLSLHLSEYFLDDAATQ